MENSFVSTVSIVINTSPTGVWEALTTPSIIKQYFFGTDVTSDWRVGSPIIYTGVWQGKKYEDKGIVLENIPEKLLKTTYWSSMSGQKDVPENYKTVTYELIPENVGTKFTITQDNNASIEEKNHTQENWKMIQNALKKLLEK